MTPYERRQELDRLTQPVLCAMYRQLGYVGGLHPPETWRKGEVIDSILAIEDQPTDGCDKCRVPGNWCGDGGFVTREQPCVLCGEPTVMRARCGAARTPLCYAGLPPAQPEPTPPAKPAAARTQPARPLRGRKADQAAATAAAITGLDEGEPVRILAALEGVFAPLRAIGGGKRSQPYWRPELPGITWSVEVVTGYAWSRPYQGKVVVLDRSGAWVTAASSAVVPHGALTPTGAIEWAGAPGYYQVHAHPWYEKGMPYPLGHVRPGTRPWISAPRVGLLADLVRQGRWPDVDVLDSYTGDGCRLTDWAGHMQALRAHALTIYGRPREDQVDDTPYDLVKQGIGQAFSLMLGRIDAGDGRRRTWDCKAGRPDITHHVQDQGSVTLWRWADDCRRVVELAGLPELAPVELRNIDELVVPVDALQIITTTPRPGGRAPLVIDPLGIKLGTFKIKCTEESGVVSGQVK